MNECFRNTDPSGSIQIEALGPVTLSTGRHAGPSQVLEESRLTWHGDDWLEDFIPAEDCSLVVRLFDQCFGSRRIIPTRSDGLGGFLVRAAWIGLAMLARRLHWDASTYRRHRLEMWAWHAAQHTQVHLGKTFGSADEVTLRPAAKRELARASLLPEIYDPLTHKVWGAGRLQREGREIAKESTLVQPNDRELLNSGLFAAAKHDPLRLNDEVEAANLIRLALFDFSKMPPSIPASDEEVLTAEVERRLAKRVPNGPDVTLAAFTEHALRNDHLVRSIAGRGEDGLDSSLVKRALLDLGWRGALVMAQSAEAFAEEIARALPAPLNDDELKYYRALFYRRPEFGGLSLLVLHDRRGLLGPVVTRLWDRPGDPKLIGALHRMLQYYADMAVVSREHERAKKNGAASAVYTKTPQQQKPPQGRAEDCYDLCAEVCKHLLEQAKAPCSTCECFEACLVDVNDGEEVTVRGRCDVHDQTIERKFSWEEIQTAFLDN
ncbi:MAG: hypothetical protein JNK76_23355 [Planctomycetales bacterium]|nr:hypothetical protein [Planctomycetales bacterium]